MVLVGFMGAGKSSVGRGSEPQAGLAFRRSGRAHPGAGTTLHRANFSAVRRSRVSASWSMQPCARWLQELGASAKVVALGGGAFAQANNAALLEEAGFSTVFLDAPVEELFRRCREQQVDRPLRGDLEEFRRLYEARRPCYLKAAVAHRNRGQGRGSR